MELLSNYPGGRRKIFDGIPIFQKTFGKIPEKNLRKGLTFRKKGGIIIIENKERERYRKWVTSIIFRNMHWSANMLSQEFTMASCGSTEHSTLWRERTLQQRKLMGVALL